MATADHGKHVRLQDLELNYWHYLAMFFAAVTIIASLGEWVFHWWDEPGQYVAGAGFVLTLLSMGFAASKLDVRRMDRRFDRIERGQDRVATSQDRIAATQDRIAATQDRLAEGQARLATAQGQAEQTALLRDIGASLREVVGSFRRPP